MRRLLLVCMLMLLPLQWSWAAAAWHVAHGVVDASGHLVHPSVDQPGDVAATDAGTEPSDSGQPGDGPCCHLDDAQWLDALPAVMAPQRPAPPRFDYFAPTSSYIPAGPERPDRSLAA